VFAELKRFTPANLAILATSFLGIMAFILVSYSESECDMLIHLTPLAFVTALPGLLAPKITADGWPQELDKRRLRHYLPEYCQLEKSLSKATPISIFILIILIIAPLLVYAIAGINLPGLFLLYWFLFTTASVLTVLVLSFAAVKRYVSQIEPQLPLPIFYDPVHMVKAVESDIWKYYRCQYPIQWLHVERNDRGGIKLIGLYRPTNELDRNTQSGDSRIFIINSDMWGKIEKFRSEIVSKNYYQRQASGNILYEDIDETFFRRNLPYLPRMINHHFNEDELYSLCHELNTNYEDLGHGSKSDKAKELVLLISQQNRLPQLVERVIILRPTIFDA
jgi:hypothetical protein